MIFADVIRDLLESLEPLPVPYPDVWRYFFIVVGLLVAGFTLAVAVEAEGLVPRRRATDRRRGMGWHIRLVALGTNLIVLLLVALVYLQLGTGPLSPLIYPALLGEAFLALGLGILAWNLHAPARSDPPDALPSSR